MNANRPSACVQFNRIDFFFVCDKVNASPNSHNWNSFGAGEQIK